MKNLILEDKNGKILNSVVFNDDEFYNPSEIREYTSHFNNFDLLSTLTKLGDNIDVLIPWDNGNDFIIDYFSDFHFAYFKNFNLSKSDLVNRLFFETLPVYKKLGFQKIFNNALNSDKSFSFKLSYYDNEQLTYSLKFSIIQFNGLLLFSNKESTYLDDAVKQENDLFNNSIHPLVVVQDYKIVRVNDAYANMLGISKDELLGRHYNINSVKIKDSSTKEWKENFKKILNKELLLYIDERNYTTLEGEELYIKTQASPVNFNGKPAVQFFTVDISKEKAIESKVTKLIYNLSNIQKFSKVTFGNLNSDLKFSWSEGVLDILEIDENDLEKSSSSNIFYDYMFSNELEDFLKFREDSIKRNKDFVYNGQIKVKTKLGNIKYLLLDVQYFFDKNGFNNGVGFVKDVTSLILKEMELESTLITLQKLYKKLDDKNSENEVLLKEIHHRVKNNLQIILSLLNLDKRFNKKDYDAIIEDTENRIHAMALIHEKVYRSDNLANINIKEYIESEISSLLSMYNSTDIKLDLDLDEFELKLDICTPLGLIINECIVNIIKYAFPKDNLDFKDSTDHNLLKDDDVNTNNNNNNNNNNYESKIISIFLKEDKSNSKFSLIIGDNGVGLPKNLDIYNSPSLGLTIINNLSSQLNGNFSILDKPGTFYKFEFPF